MSGDAGCACRSARESLIEMLDAALRVILIADSLDLAQGVAHAALNREEYHGLQIAGPETDR